MKISYMIRAIGLAMLCGAPAIIGYTHNFENKTAYPARFVTRFNVCNDHETKVEPGKTGTNANVSLGCTTTETDAWVTVPTADGESFEIQASDNDADVLGSATWQVTGGQEKSTVGDQGPFSVRKK